MHRNFRAWEETWEKKKIDPKGEKVQETRLLRKYGGLKWLNLDNNMVFTARADEMIFEKNVGTTSIMSLELLMAMTLM